VVTGSKGVVISITIETWSSAGLAGWLGRKNHVILHRESTISTSHQRQTGSRVPVPDWCSSFRHSAMHGGRPAALHVGTNSKIRLLPTVRLATKSAK